MKTWQFIILTLLLLCIWREQLDFSANIEAWKAVNLAVKTEFGLFIIYIFYRTIKLIRAAQPELDEMQQFIQMINRSGK